MRLFLQGAVPAKPEVDSIWGMSRVYLGHTWGSPGVDLGSTWNTPVVYLGFTSGISGSDRGGRPRNMVYLRYT